MSARIRDAAFGPCSVPSMIAIQRKAGGCIPRRGPDQRQIDRPLHHGLDRHDIMIAHNAVEDIVGKIAAV
ncbi:hypothetical protein A8V01_16760 [Novosphingobium guangzhouense]|uniref:Uncharacterized protein n=1 Tax=Novosphingobium guangzhouense TaxID=1850347 RepID=A0A2K2G356_9SPHN|nr:hypothetical protein A8V01_16760 [Novosphingobium guangzhouense]